jgi:DNA-binding NtrC family response regulator
MLHSATHAGIIHLLISDVVLAEVSGPELAKLLVKSRPAMKVLCMSSYTDYVAGDDIGDADIPSLQKPIALDSLTTKVRQVLDAANDTPPRSTMRPAARLS